MICLCSVLTHSCLLTVAANAAFGALGGAMQGKIGFDDVVTGKVTPVHVHRDGMTLGADEFIETNRYFFRPHHDTWRTDYTRALYHRRATFEGYYGTGGGPSRWAFQPGDHLVYRHQIGRPQRSASCEVNLISFVSGQALLDVSKDNKEWRVAGRFPENGNHRLHLPTDLFPANSLFVRIRSEGRFSLYAYGYEAELLDGAPDLVGNTCFLKETPQPKSVEVTMNSPGDLVPGGENLFSASVLNREARERRVEVRLGIGAQGTAQFNISRKLRLNSGRKAEVHLPYRLLKGGDHELTLTATDADSREILYRAVGAFTVPLLMDSDFGYRLSGPKGLDVWWCEATYKIGRNRFLPSKQSTCIQLSAARNEYEPFQLALRPAKGHTRVQITASDLRGPGNAVLKKENIKINRVEYKLVKYPDDAFGCVSEWPDALPELQGSLDLVARKNQPVWVTIYVPDRMPAGTYRGTMTIRGVTAEPFQVPLRLRVWDFTLPEETHTKTAFGIWMNSVMPFFHAARTEEERDAVHDLYMQNFSAHRIAPVTHNFNLIDYVSISEKAAPEGEFDLDFGKLDRWSHRIFDELRLPSYCAGWYRDREPPFGRLGRPHYFGEPGFTEFDPVFERNFTSIYGALTQHLRQKGWLDRTYFYLFDEPFAGERYAQVREGARLLKEACPGLKGLVTVQFEPSLYGFVHIWVPPLHRFDANKAEERRRAGDEIWWYVACGPRYPYPNNLIDSPAINHRIHFWMMQKYGITGTLYWSVNYYRGMDRPGKLREVVNPWDTAICLSPDGGFNGNGDGVLVYPPTREPVAQPVYGDSSSASDRFYDPHNGTWFCGLGVCT